MADARRVLELVFSGTDDLSPKIAAITKEFDKGLGSVNAFAAPLANMTEQLLALEAAVVVAGVALGTYAVTEAIKFQDATVELDKVLGDTERTVQSFGDSALALSNKYGEAAVDVQLSFAAFAAAGFAATEVEGLTESMLKLARVSELDVAQGTEAALRIMAGFGAEAATLPRTLDLVNESTNKYGTNVANLTEALARAAPIAKQGNFTIEETIGVLTPIIEVFKDAEMSGTAFVTVIQRLTSDNKNVTEALGDLGVKQLDVNLKMRSARDILFDVGKAYQTLEPSQKAVTTQMLAGTEQAAKFAVVFNNIDKVSQVVKDSLAGVGTSVDKELTKRMGATSAVIDVFTTRMHNAAIIAGGPFLDAVKRLAGSGGTLGLVLQDLAKSEGFKTFAAKVSAQLDRAGVAIEKFAQALPKALEKVDLTAFNEQLKLLGLSFEGLFDGIDLTTPEGLAKALQKVVDIGAQFLGFTRGLVDQIKPVIAHLRELGAWVSQLDPDLITMVGQLGGAATVFTLLSPAILAASQAMGAFGKLIGVGGGILAHIEKVSAANTLMGIGFVKNAGYIGLAAAGGYAVGTGFNFLIDKLTQATTQFDSVGEAMYVLVHGASPALMTSTEALAASTAALADKQGTLTEATAATGGAWKVAKGEVDGIGDVYNAVSLASLQLTEALGKVSAGTTAHAIAMQETAHGLQSYLDSVQEVDGATRDLTLSLDLAEKGFYKNIIAGNDYEAGVRRMVPAISFAGEALTKQESALTKTAEAQKKSAEAMAKMALETDKLELEWAKLESHNRELVFKATVDLQIEHVKAQAEQFKAIMSSLDKAIESTGSTLLGLANLFATSQRTLGGGEILSLLRAEEDRRKQSFDLQKKMTEAQLKYLDASTQRLSKGDALITIKAEGLEPELRAVLFKVVELAHIEASGVAGPMLLGLPNI